MKKFIFTILSLTIIAGAYGVAFGVPEQVTQLWGGRATETAAAPQSAQDGRRGQGRATTVVLTPLEARAYTLVLRTIGSAVSLHRTEVTATDAGEVIETALAAPTSQDALMTFDTRWRLEMAEYLRMPNTDMEFLIPLIFSNPPMADRVTNAFFLGENI